jgi:hypothetical protein
MDSKQKYTILAEKFLSPFSTYFGIVEVESPVCLDEHMLFAETQPCAECGKEILE